MKKLMGMLPPPPPVTDPLSEWNKYHEHVYKVDLPW